ncbi:MAG: bifunctional metallophosphatase/5'-nucleotidase [Bacteroidetes bacterium]|nr:MAG: bifunctional metallophosphatase/5'-nucleotidase [Bacteroidota bacterium]
MNRRGFIRNGFAGIAGLSLGATPLNLLAGSDFFTLSVLHTNDLHCHIEPFTGGNENTNGKGGLARISEMVKRVKAENPNTLLFDAGDMFQGTPYYNYFKGELMLQLMSAVGYDAGTIGNHEFDDGLEGIADSLHSAKFPLVCSNYDFSNTMLAGKFPRWKVFEKSKIKIGVYGLGIELKGLVADKNFGNTIYNDPLKTAIEMESFLKNENKCDLVICLSHLGLRYRDNKISDMVLASETSLTDLIIGGHTHSFLEEPIVTKNKTGNQVIVNQASSYGQVMGKIDFIFERSKKRMKTAVAHNLIPGDEA